MSLACQLSRLTPKYVASCPLPINQPTHATNARRHRAGDAARSGAKDARAAADLDEQRGALAAARSAVADKAQAVDGEARELALQRADFERQVEAFQAQVAGRVGWKGSKVP